MVCKQAGGTARTGQRVTLRSREEREKEMMSAFYPLNDFMTCACEPCTMRRSNAPVQYFQTGITMAETQPCATTFTGCHFKVFTILCSGSDPNLHLCPSATRQSPFRCQGPSFGPLAVHNLSRCLRLWNENTSKSSTGPSGLLI